MVGARIRRALKALKQQAGQEGLEYLQDVEVCVEVFVPADADSVFGADELLAGVGIVEHDETWNGHLRAAVEDRAVRGDTDGFTTLDGTLVGCTPGAVTADEQDPRHPFALRRREHLTG